MEIPKDPLGQVLADAGAIVAYLFGLRANSTHTDHSDVDVAILTDRDLSLREELAVTERLASALQVAEVDLVLLHRAPLELRGKVVQEGRPIYCSDETRRVDFEVRTRSEYFDFLPSLRAQTTGYLRSVAQREPTIGWIHDAGVKGPCQAETYLCLRDML